MTELKKNECKRCPFLDTTRFHLSHKQETVLLLIQPDHYMIYIELDDT